MNSKSKSPSKATLWHELPNLDALNQVRQNTIHESLGIVFSHVDNQGLEATMPVDSRTHQPLGLLHGGASAVLAESLGSIASMLVVGREATEKGTKCVGIELNASHLKGVRSGSVTGRVTPVRIGRSLHVWEIRIWNTQDGDQSPICISRLTVMVIGQ